MKRFILTISFIISSVVVFGQIPNAGFESWTNKGPYEEPDLWESYNILYPDWGVVVCEKITDHTEGSYALKLTSKYSSMISGVVPGWVYLWGYPFSDRPDTFYFDYKYQKFGNDKGGIMMITFSRFDSSQNKSITICKKMNLFQTDVTTWTTVAIRLNYTSSSNPDSMSIIFASSDEAYADTNSYLMIDKLHFDRKHSSLPGVEPITLFRIFPNPAVHSICIDFPQQQTNPSTLKILNPGGKIIIERVITTDSSNPVELPLEGLKTGMYILSVCTADKIYVKKFAVIAD